MAQTPSRILFGIHSITPYNRVSKKPYGIMKVVGSASMGLSSDLEKLFAGSSKFPLAAEAKTVDAELNLKVKEYPDFLFELFLGATVTKIAASPTGAVSAKNVKGVSILNGTNGIDVEVATGGEANLKEGKYVIVATAAGTAKVYALSDVDFNRGIDLAYLDDEGLVAEIDVASADDVVAELGISFTKNGTPAFVAGDAAEFEVLPPHAGTSDIKIGGSATTFPAFGAIVVAQKRATGEIFRIDAPNLVASGLPIPLEEQTFSQPEVKLGALYDKDQDAVFKIRAYRPAE